MLLCSAEEQTSLCLSTFAIDFSPCSFCPLSGGLKHHWATSEWLAVASIHCYLHFMSTDENFKAYELDKHLLVEENTMAAQDVYILKLIIQRLENIRVH